MNQPRTLAASRLETACIAMEKDKVFQRIFSILSIVFPLLGGASPELTSVEDDKAVFYKQTSDGGSVSSVVKDLQPDTSYHKFGTTFRTLSRPQGKLFKRFCYCK